MMKTPPLSTWLALAFSFMSATSESSRAQGTAFTYQGRLTLGGIATSGSWEMQFKLYDAPANGNQKGSTLTIAPVVVNGGLFTVTLDFGSTAFDGTGRWIELGARTNGSAAAYAAMLPRAAIVSAPYSIHAGNGVPVGSVMAFMGQNPPSGWLLCNGVTVSRTNFAALFAVIGTSSGPGDGSTTFHLPDMRGMFLRGVNAGRTDSWRDPDASGRFTRISGGNSGDNVGSMQNHELWTHTHAYLDSIPHGTAGTEVDSYSSGSNDNIYRTDTSRETGPKGGSETRPNNVYVHYIIKH